MAGNAQGQTQPTTLKEYLLSDTSATTQFVLRMITVVSSLIFVIFGLGFSLGVAYRFYLNALMAAFFTFAIRFYQRVKTAQVSVFSRQFLEVLMMEDSAHYMLYTFFFYNQIPQIVYIIPIFLYAVLFSTKYVNGLAPFLPSSVGSTLVGLGTHVSTRQQQMHRVIAYCEVFIMPIVIMNVFTGSMFLLAPLLYYQFLKLRYMSRRNASVRSAMTELRMTAQYLAHSPKCPQLVRNIIDKMIALISSLAPVPTVVPAPNQATGQPS